MLTIPAEFLPHFRKSPVTDPWEPLYSRRGTGAVDLLFEIRPAHCNSREHLHGGVLAALCDNVMGLSLGTVLNDPKISIVTINLSLDYLGSAQIGSAILISPRVLKAGNNIGFCEARVSCDDRSIARANATFSVRKALSNAPASIP